MGADIVVCGKCGGIKSDDQVDAIIFKKKLCSCLRRRAAVAREAQRHVELHRVEERLVRAVAVLGDAEGLRSAAFALRRALYARELPSERCPTCGRDVPWCAGLPRKGVDGEPAGVGSAVPGAGQ